jgi:hypothetical protein
MSAKVTFRITTYYKRPRNEPGLTQMGTRRVSLGEALDWVLAELPEDAVTLTPDIEGDHDAMTVRIDWAKVPIEIRDGAS